MRIASAKFVFSCAVAIVSGLFAAAGQADASVVYSDDFHDATGDPNFHDFSQVGTGIYWYELKLPGWTQQNTVLGWSTDPSNTISGIYLHENGGSIALSTAINGLTIGSQYTLSFNYWGDNIRDSPYGLNYTINGVTNAVSVTSWTSSQSGSHNTETYIFTAAATSTSLMFQETTPYGGASPIIGNVMLQTGAVPEPTTFALLGLGGTGLAINAIRRRVTRPRVGGVRD